MYEKPQRTRDVSERSIRNSLQPKKNSMRKLRKRMDSKGTNTINTFLKLNLSPLPLTEMPVENKCERLVPSTPSVAQPKPSIPLQDYRQGHSSHALT